jgi:hypothetical protein
MNKDVTSLLVKIVRTFQKYSLTIFIVVLTSGLATAVLLLNATLQEASDTTNYTSDLGNTSFDQATIERVEQLHTSSEITTDAPLPNGRINPFSE